MRSSTFRSTCLFVISLWIVGLSIQSTRAAFVDPVTDREKVQLSGVWKFTTSNTLTGADAPGYDDSAWASVTVPHTWNSVDASSNRIADFSNSWYRTHFTIPAVDVEKRINVSFEGAFQVADVYVNGVHLGQHRGGYTRFTYDATDAINFGSDNVLAVMVSNKDCADSLPDGNTRLFKGYGGIYRKVWLIKTSKYHVSNSHYSSNGVYVTPSNVSGASGDVSINTYVGNSDDVSKTFTVKNFVTDANENFVLQMQRDVVLPARSRINVVQTGTVSTPVLWNKSNPYLYNVHVTVWVDGAIQDAVTERIGFRYYQLTATDFTLNGISTKLRGVSKHQESEYHASAVTDTELIEDWDNILDLGANYVRLPHYPHAELEYDLADERGIMVWAENGQTNGSSTSQPTANGSKLTLEMVYQNWNHPSIIFWSAGNESGGVSATSQYAADIQSADSSRPVVYASNGQSPSNVDYIWMNIYPGWYSGSMYDFLLHKGCVSESGAGMVIGTHTADGFAMNHTVNSYEPEEYGALDNEVKFQTLFVNSPSNIPAFSNWVFREFGDNKYKNHVNTKGLLTFSNYRKDAYYLYKSFLSSSPVVYIAGEHYFLRDSDADGGGDVKVYSNSANITLTVNGVNRGSRADGEYSHPNGTKINNVFRWNNVMNLGRNEIVADDGNGHTHTITVYYKGSGQTMPNENGAKVMNVTSSGSAAFFINRPISSQRPFYRDFDGTGDNSFDVVPSAVSGASWIATKRQSNSVNTASIGFDLIGAADVYIMCTKQASTPSFISSGGYADTAVTGKWRDNNMKLVDYKLYKRVYTGATHVSLGSATLDFVILVK